WGAGAGAAGGAGAGRGGRAAGAAGAGAGEPGSAAVTLPDVAPLTAAREATGSSATGPGDGVLGVPAGWPGAGPLRPSRPPLAGGGLAPAVRAALGWSRGNLAIGFGCRGLLGTLRRERFFEPADNGRLDCRGRRPHKLAHLLELGHHGLALYAELLRELVYPDLRHCAPSTRSGIAGPSGRPGREAPAGVRFWCSSPRSHRALITIGSCFPGSNAVSVPPRAGHPGRPRPGFPAQLCQILPEHGGVGGPAQPERPAEPAPTLCLLETCLARMHIGAPTRQPRLRVRDNLIPAPD